MRLFKRHSSDTSPQLVSATPISQDGNNTTTENNESFKLSTGNENSSSRKSDVENSNVIQERHGLSPPSTSFMARKGISTWGKKVGKRWDQLKRTGSSELLPEESVSGRRRRWSPNRKSIGDISNDKEFKGSTVCLSQEFAKPKRISRVESLRNFFRSSERNNNLFSNEAFSRTLTIQEEDGSCHQYSIEKALSEGVLKNVPFRSSSGSRKEYDSLHEKKEQISRSINDLQEQQRLLHFLEHNHGLLKTQEGTKLAIKVLNNDGKSETKSNRLSRTSCSSIEAKTENYDGKNDRRDMVKENCVKRNLFNNRSSEKDRPETQRKPISVTGLEDLLANLRTGCDESGYDSDSTRAGADSPDSEKSSIPAMLKIRSFSMISDDYEGVDLSMPASTPQKHPPEDFSEPMTLNDTLRSENPLIINNNADVTSNVSKLYLNDSAQTNTTTLVSDDDTDSCDETTFEEFTDFRLHSRNSSSSSLKNSETLKKRSLEDPDPIGPFYSPTLPKTPAKLPARNDRTKLNHQLQKETKPLGLLNRRESNVSFLNLLDNASSPCKDSPPATKVHPAVFAKPIDYYSPKRTRSKMNLESMETMDTPVSQTPSSRSQASPQSSSKSVKTLVRRELKTMKLIIETPGSLGLSVERKEAARPYYVISKMDPHGEAAKSSQIRIGDEIVRICGRRLRGMSISEARVALKNCVGVVELQIAREPMFNFGSEIGDTWGDTLTRTRRRSDSEVWSIKKPEVSSETEVEPSEDPELELRQSKRCKIVGALTKDGKCLSANTLNNRLENVEKKSQKKENDAKEENEKVTGMKKFQVVKKRHSSPAVATRRATSLSMDLLTIVLEKGSNKKLGFSIVGGSDSNKGNMGIFVKDIKSDGQAAEEGTLKTGDEILAINGTSLEGLTHAKALQTFKNAKSGKMILHIGRRDTTHKRLLRRS